MAQNNMTLTVPLIGVLDQEGIDIINKILVFLGLGAIRNGMNS